MKHPPVPTGIPELDDVLQGLVLGDNVVWQVDGLGDYAYFAQPFARRAIADGRKCVYIRFAAHSPILRAGTGLTIVEVDPSAGFDAFSREVHRIVHDLGREVFYVLDNLSSLVEEWTTDEQLANFFQVTCPFLYELDTVAYFALMRGKHDYSAIARIRETTQVLIDVYRVKGEMYIHPLKVYGRYSPQMFLPHAVSEHGWSAIMQSGEAAAVSGAVRRHPMRIVANSIAPWESIFRRLVEFQEARPVIPETEPEVVALKQELCRMMIGSHPALGSLTDRYLSLNELFSIRNRMIGSGRIGGKAAGMLIARQILLGTRGVDFWQVLEDHDSYFIGSDVFFTFLVNNDLFRLRLQLSRNPHLTEQEFEEVERRFLAGTFPAEMMEQFRTMLDYFGQAPIIVRSSSFLEDSFGNAFAGKYRSEFCANQGPPEHRMEEFLRAVKLVYASALNPDAISYRHRRGLGDSDEQMAILVQRVSGMPFRKFFLPSLAGVAFSRNLYVWSDKIDPAQGVVRLVFGLGTRAVNRVGGDYPRMIAISQPQLRPEVGSRIVRYSQHQADVLDLEQNALVTRPIADLIGDRDFPNLRYFVSTMQDGLLQDPLTDMIGGDCDLVLTFNNLIANTEFVNTMGAMLTTLEQAYGQAVDIEFTASIGRKGQVRVNLLQCRPLWTPAARREIAVPESIPADRVLFRAGRLVNGGDVSGIRYLLYVDPRRYAPLEDVDAKRTLGRIVGRVNRHPLIADGKIVMMGPGRWGSSNIHLGVNVGYADIRNAAALVELAFEEAGHLPEVSYGTHFFQDIVESQIIYLPVYPDDPAAEFNAAFFDSAANALTELLPDAAEFSELVKVIDVPAVAGGRMARVVADPQSRRAVCFVE